MELDFVLEWLKAIKNPLIISLVPIAYGFLLGQQLLRTLEGTLLGSQFLIKNASAIGVTRLLGA